MSTTLTPQQQMDQVHSHEQQLETIHQRLADLAFESRAVINGGRWMTSYQLIHHIEARLLSFTKGHTRETIELCGKCEGKGYWIHSELRDYHRNEYDDERRSCKECEGTGRLEVTTTVRKLPYRPEREEGE